ncbi:MAG: Hsp20/alpha crystallin family protein [Planctomycetia bacterium]|nr:Hsp20/alpha crystallin family protein [Planctomycetia bacterium]
MKTVACEADCKLMDLKTRYDIEIPAVEENDSFVVSINNGILKVNAVEENGTEVTLGTWDIREGVHTEAMTTEYRDGILYLRLPKGDEVRPRELQYSEKITIKPTC